MPPRRRIRSLTEDPEMRVRDGLAGRVELALVGERLDVRAELDEYDLRLLATLIREAFGTIRSRRDGMNRENQRALEGDA